VGFFFETFFGKYIRSGRGYCLFLIGILMGFGNHKQAIEAKSHEKSLIFTYFTLIFNVFDPKNSLT
jgi:hypothetical protein